MTSSLLRVTHISPTSFGPDGIVGGGERYPHQLALAMAAKAPTRLVTFGPEAGARTEGPLEIITLRTRAYWKGNEVNPISEHVLRPFVHTDVVHVHQWDSTVANAAIVMSRALGKKIFVTDHGGGGINYWRRLHLDRLVTGFLPVSRFGASHYPELADRTTVILGGVDTVRFSPGPAVRPRRALFVGRLLPHKGIDTLLAAVTATTPLVVIGRPYNRDFRQELLALAAGKPVEFRESVGDDDLVEAYRTSRVCVLPSVYRPSRGAEAKKPELLGLALLESMACATPVICSDVGGMPEIVRDGHNGFVVPPGEPAPLRSKLALLLDDDDVWGAMSAEALRYARANTWSRVADRCLQIYQAA